MIWDSNAVLKALPMPSGIMPTASTVTAEPVDVQDR